MSVTNIAMSVHLAFQNLCNSILANFDKTHHALIIVKALLAVKISEVCEKRQLPLGHRRLLGRTRAALVADDGLRVQGEDLGSRLLQHGPEDERIAGAADARRVGLAHGLTQAVVDPLRCHDLGIAYEHEPVLDALDAAERGQGAFERALARYGDADALAAPTLYLKGVGCELERFVFGLPHGLERERTRLLGESFDVRGRHGLPHRLSDGVG